MSVLVSKTAYGCKYHGMTEIANILLRCWTMYCLSEASRQSRRSPNICRITQLAVIFLLLKIAFVLLRSAFQERRDIGTTVLNSESNTMRDSPFAMVWV